MTIDYNDPKNANRLGLGQVKYELPKLIQGKDNGIQKNMLEIIFDSTDIYRPI